MTNTGTAALKSTAAGIEILFNEETLAVIKDGDNLIKRAERVLRAAHIYRSSGYELDGSRRFVASAMRVAK